MTTETRSLLVALATLVVGLVVVERGLAWYGPRHFIPERRMQQAVAGRPGCIVMAGDSRMVAAYDREALLAGLRAGGRDECVDTVAIGALRIPGLAIAVRQYLDRGAKPKLMVLGASEDTLLARPEPYDPSTFVGNEATLLSWSRPGDVVRLYPDFPANDPRAFDQGFRFLVLRSNAFGQYLSLAWQKIQTFQDRVTGRTEAGNVFGALSDMEARGRAMELAARQDLVRALERPEAERLDPWFSHLERRVQNAGSRLFVVELPMPASYREGITLSPNGRRYLAWLARRLERNGGALIDLASPKLFEPSDFADFVHVNEAGARRFSHDLGLELAKILNEKRADAPRR
jgi:hypothetical protein